jgi:hypothetical protein
MVFSKKKYFDCRSSYTSLRYLGVVVILYYTIVFELGSGQLDQNHIEYIYYLVDMRNL